MGNSNSEISKSLIFMFMVLFYGLSLVAFGIIIAYHIGRYFYFLSIFMLAVPFSLILIGTLTASLIFLQFSAKKKYGTLFLTIMLLIEIGIATFILVEQKYFSNILLEKCNLSFSNYLFKSKDREEWSFLQQNLQCCGINKIENWSRILKPGLLPASCCPLHKSDEKLLCRYAENKFSVHNTGCYEKLLNKIQWCTFFTLVLVIIAIILQTITASLIFIKTKFWEEDKFGELQ